MWSENKNNWINEFEMDGFCRKIKILNLWYGLDQFTIFRLIEINLVPNSMLNTSYGILGNYTWATKYDFETMKSIVFLYDFNPYTECIARIVFSRMRICRESLHFLCVPIVYLELRSKESTYSDCQIPVLLYTMQTFILIYDLSRMWIQMWTICPKCQY